MDDVIAFYNHSKLDRAYHDFCKNKNVITAVEILDYVGYEHYLLIGKQNGHIHHYKVDFETIDDYIRYYEESQFPGYFYKSILRYHSKEVVSIKYNPYLNLWISSSKDGYVHIFNYNGDLILSTFIKNNNIKYAILASDPIPCFVVYFDNEFNCYLINQVKPIRKLNLKTELYNFDIIKSNGFEDFLICQDENKIYIISLPYLEIVYEIKEKVTSFDYLPNEKLIIGFLRHEDENKVTIKKIKCDI
jgi:WD40 repeat protein